jgi:hypothetical protein
VDQIALIEEWTKNTYTNPIYKTGYSHTLGNETKKRFQDLEGLPESMRSITEEHDRRG